MENPRPEKVAVVDEVKTRLGESEAVLLTEYRGLDVPAISELRRALRAAGGDYKIYKNSLVGFAVRDLGLDLEDLLTGPTAMAFVTTQPDGTPGDAVTVAKALRDFAKGNPNLVVKGGCSVRPAVRRRCQGPRRRGSPRGAAGQTGRWPGCADGAVRRTAAGPAPQLRLRPCRP
jgi:ribosomal protein L10